MQLQQQKQNQGTAHRVAFGEAAIARIAKAATNALPMVQICTYILIKW